LSAISLSISERRALSLDQIRHRFALANLIQINTQISKAIASQLEFEVATIKRGKLKKNRECRRLFLHL